MGTLIKFNGRSSDEFRLIVEHYPARPVPKRKFEKWSVPGRSGDLIVHRAARVNNDLITYPAFIAPTNDRGVLRPYPEMVSKLRAWLLSVRGYAALTDSYDCEHYRMAAFAGPITFESLPDLSAGSFEIPFNCKPQRYLQDDVGAFSLSAFESLTVDAGCRRFSEPLIIVTGTGSFTVGGKTITIADNSLTGPIYIDARIMDCYDSNGVNANRFVSFSDYEFPVIEDGTVINAGAGDLEVKPRWYEL